MPGRDVSCQIAAVGDDASFSGRKMATISMVLSRHRASGSLLIKFHHSGDQIQENLRKIADAAKDDTILPGEEKEPEAVFKLAAPHNGDNAAPVFVELIEWVEWEPLWVGSERARKAVSNDGTQVYSRTDPG